MSADAFKGFYCSMTCSVVLPGSGGGAPDLSGLKVAPGDSICFEVIRYPGWKRYVELHFTPELFVAELAAEIETRVPHGPIRIVGISMGGHFGYLVALHLQAQGREVEGVCAIDSFMVTTAEPTPGWKDRALSEALEILRQGRVRELLWFVRSKFWRAALRGAGDRLPHLLRKLSHIAWLSHALDIDPILTRELDVRMMAREVAPWLARLDEKPVPLSVPVAFLRTRLNADSDAPWRSRCPNLVVHEINGTHHTLFEPENISSLRDAFVEATREWS
jgi:thioesterase domain-containing protein